MDQDFSNEQKEDKVIYPIIKLWHLFLFFAIVTPLIYYFK